MIRRRGIAGTTLRATRVAVHLLAGLATTLVVFPRVNVPRRRELIRAWSTRLLDLLNVHLRVQRPLQTAGGNVLIVANHVSWLDILVLNAQQPSRFVAKAEIGSWPLAGRLVRNVGTLFIARDRRHDTKHVNRHAAEALMHGDVVAVFPEGTTTDGTTLLRFHASLLQPIVESHGRVQPVALRYRDADGRPTTVASYGDETFARSFWRICGEPTLVVDVIATPPIAARDRHRRELACAAEAAIRTALGLAPGSTAPGTRVDRRAASR